MKSLITSLICLISLTSAMQVDVSFDYLRSLFKLDQHAFNEIINKELPKGYKTKFTLSDFKVTQSSLDQFDVTIPGVISLFS